MGKANSKPSAQATDLAQVLAALQAQADPVYRQGLTRFAIPIDRALGVSMVKLKLLAKPLRGRHELALALWEQGIYEARLLAALIDDPKQVSGEQMDRWVAGFDNWGDCDTACFALFDRTPHAWQKVDEWAPRPEEFVRRAAFATLASLTVHDKKASDEMFLARLPLIEQAADDPRNFVKKAVNWALRSIGKRNARLHAQAIALAELLAAREDPAARWIGKDALRELRKLAQIARVNRKQSQSAVRRA